jgi:hypothetical protein
VPAVEPEVNRPVLEPIVLPVQPVPEGSVHVAIAVKSAWLLSEKLPFAVNCCVFAWLTITAPGVTVIVESVTMVSEIGRLVVCPSVSTHLRVHATVPVVGVPVMLAVVPTFKVRPDCVAAPLVIDHVTAPVAPAAVNVWL